MLNSHKKPKLTLVGAGPGDPELISIKGVKAIANADVILYDALVHSGLLDYGPKAVKIFVGKRGGLPSITQEEINEIIVEYAYSHGNVVRLKGGDPFIFGRGQEELEYARMFSIETEVVPGISSATGLASLQQLPLTMRGSNESFWVITGTNSKRQLSADLTSALQTSATVVLMMGISKLSEIVKTYQEFKKFDLPVAIIQEGSTTNEKIVFGSVDTIVETAGVEKIKSPAVIIIGDNVRLHPSYPKTIEDSIRKLSKV